MHYFSSLKIVCSILPILTVNLHVFLEFNWGMILPRKFYSFFFFFLFKLDRRDFESFDLFAHLLVFSVTLSFG